VGRDLNSGYYRRSDFDIFEIEKEKEVKLMPSAFGRKAGYIRGVLYSLTPKDKKVYYHWFSEPGMLSVFRNKIVGFFSKALKWDKGRGFLN
jgi:hypothetical protein